MGEGDTPKKDLVFIASGGRTGTTFFGERLADVIEGCFSEHEPDVVAWDLPKTLRRLKTFGLWHMIFGRLLGLTGLRVLGHRLMVGEIDEETCLRRLGEQRVKYHAMIKEPLLIESSWRYWMIATRLNKLWPDAKILGIIRDPRDWVESWRRHQPKRHTKGFMGWFPLGPLTPAQVGDSEWADRWEDLDQFGRLAWDWRTICGQLDEAAQTAPHFKMVRFEDLFMGEDDAIMREVVDFVATHGEPKYKIGDLDGFSKTVRNASPGSKRNWRKWPPEEAKLLDDMCGELMRKYGYGNEPEWRALVEQASREG